MLVSWKLDELELSWKPDDTWHSDWPGGRGFGDHLHKKRCIRSLANKSETEKLTRKECVKNTWKEYNQQKLIKKARRPQSWEDTAWESS